MFLKLDDIKGESQDQKHKDEIDVLVSRLLASRGDLLEETGKGSLDAVAIPLVIPEIFLLDDRNF